MKINLLLDSQDVLNSYLNIDPFSETQDKLKGEITNLDWIVDDGEAEEILAYNILEFFEFGKADEILNNWLRKLAKGGILIIGYNDIDEIARLFYQTHIELDQFNKLVFGEQKRGWDFKKCGFTTYQLSEVLKNKGYKIRQAKIEGIAGVIVAERIA